MAVVLYAEDMEDMPEASEKYFKNVDYLICDAAMYFNRYIRGHMNVQQALALVKKYDPKEAILTQAGHTYPTYDKSVNEIRDYWYSIKGDSTSKIHLSFDGLEIDTKSKSNLQDEFELMQQPFGSPGGKLQISKKLIKVIPKHKTYVEPFAGAAAVYFKKPKDISEIEVLNDKNTEISFTYKYIQSVTPEKISRLRQFDWNPNRERFYKLVKQREAGDFKSNDDRFFKFLYTNFHSYGCDRDSFGYKESGPAILERMEKTKERLKGTKIYSQDYKEIIKKFDAKDTFFYIDPPYPGSWRGRSLDKWTHDTYKELHGVLKNVEGKFLLSMGRDKELKKIFSDFKIVRIKTRRNVDKVHRFFEYEYLVSNFNPEVEELAVELSEKEKHVTNGMYLVSPHAEMIWSDEKSLIIKAKYFDIENDQFFIVSDAEEGNGKCYGIIEINSIEEISPEQFKKLHNVHKISDEEVEEWWGGKRDKYYAYTFTVLSRFEEPRKVKVKKGIQTFIQGIEFLWDIETLIEDIREYKPEKPNNEQLIDDWKIIRIAYINKWGMKQVKNKPTLSLGNSSVRMSLEDILNLAKIIHDEIVKRIKEKRMKYDFEPEKMDILSRELYSIVSKNYPKIHTELKEMKGKLTKEDFDLFPNEISLIERYVCVGGSSVDKQDKRPDDIDLIIRLGDAENLRDFLKRNTAAELRKCNERAHPFAEVHGPAGVRMPMYDLKMVKRKWESTDIEMSEHEKGIEIIETKEKVELFKPIKPMKPKHRFYEADDLLDYLYGKTPDAKYGFELKLNGFHSIIEKRGDEVKIYSDQGNDITFPFPTAVKQAKELSKKDFIIDCEFIPFKEGEPMGRNYAAKYIGAVKSKKGIDDKEVRFYAFDCLYYDKSIVDLQWYERKKIMQQLKFSKVNNIKFVPAYIADDKSEARELIEKLKAPRMSEGAIIKRVKAPYAIGKDSDALIKFRLETFLKTVVLDALPVKGTDANRFVQGIYLTEKEVKSIHQKYLTEYDDKPVLKLGNTFNTLIKASKGDIINIRVEEVWRHSKGDQYHYSLHKPNVDSISKTKLTSTIEDLEDAVMAKGVQVTENSENGVQDILLFKDDKEGKEIEVSDFPKRMQENFLAIKKENKWMPFSMQWHYRGHSISDEERAKENIPEKYKWKLDSLHVDDRHLVPKGYLEGITILSPTSSNPEIKDILKKEEDAKKGKIRCVLKLIEPKDWMNAQGIAKIGDPGSTPKAPGVFVIVAKGKYTIEEVDDHRVRIHYKCDKGSTNKSVLKKAEKEGIYITRKPPAQLKDLDGVWQFQIAHIGERHIILLRLMEGTKQLSDKLMEKIHQLFKEPVRFREVKIEEVVKIAELSQDGESRPFIAKTLDKSIGTVYNYQKKLDLL